MSSRLIKPMRNPISSQSIIAYSLIAIMCASCLMVTFGWHLRSFGATSFYLGTATMKYNSALCFLALAVGLLCIDIHWFKLQKLVSLLTIAIASATLSQYIFSWNIGVDQLFSFDVWQPHNPGRMAPISAVAFILAGILLFTRGFK